MFADVNGEKRLIDACESFKPDVVYFDGIRLVDYAVRIRRRFPSTRIVMDFDDLMSRRARILLGIDQPLSAGYLARSIPKVLVKAINSRAVRRATLRYEEFSLRMHERIAVANSDAVTLVSTSDADALVKTLSDPLTDKVHVIPPPVDGVKPVMRAAAPMRFVFIGSDRQLQNVLAIEYLIELWKRLRVAMPLVIYGAMTRHYEPVANVEFAGFARTLDEVYTPNSIALCPAILRGGIKSKVLEAISFGCIPVGNAIAFEGLTFHDDALAMDPPRLERFLANPTLELDTVLAAAKRFSDHCAINHNTQVFARRWAEVARPQSALTVWDEEAQFADTADTLDCGET